MNKGWKESFTALAALIVIAFALYLLTGCSGMPMRATIEYEHHSSAQDYYDLNTSDMLGTCVSAILSRNPTPYSAEAEACLMWEVTGVPVYGRDPVGGLRIRKPVWVRR